MEVQEPFLELEDLLYPIGADGSKCMSPDFLLAHHLGRDFPGHEAANNIHGNLECWEPTFGHVSSLPFNAGEMGNQSDLQLLVRNNLYGNWECWELTCGPTAVPHNAGETGDLYPRQQFARANSGNTYELQMHLQCGSSSIHQRRFGSFPACFCCGGAHILYQMGELHWDSDLFHARATYMSRMRWLLADPKRSYSCRCNLLRCLRYELSFVPVAASCQIGLSQV